MANVYMGHDVEDFIFGEGTTYEENTFEEECTVTDEEMDACGIQECVDEPEVAFYRIALENEMNYNAIMNAMMSREFSVLESTGAEIVYEAENTKSFFEKIKQMIESFWRKVQGVFKKVVDMIGSLAMSNKKFVEKYKKEAGRIQKPAKDKKFKGYNFPEDMTIDYDAVAKIVADKVKPSDVAAKSEDEANNFVEDFRNRFSYTKNVMRGKLCGESSVVEENFKTALHKKLYGTAGKATELTEIPAFAKVLDELGSAASAKKTAKEAYDKAKKACKELRTQVKQAESTLRKSEGRKNPGMKVAKCLTDSINAALTIMSTAMSAQSGAIIAKARQYRSIGAWYVSHQPTKDYVGTSESAYDDIDNLVIL